MQMAAATPLMHSTLTCKRCSSLLLEHLLSLKSIIACYVLFVPYLNEREGGGEGDRTRWAGQTCAPSWDAEAEAEAASFARTRASSSEIPKKRGIFSQ